MRACMLCNVHAYVHACMYVTVKRKDTAHGQLVFLWRQCPLLFYLGSSKCKCVFHCFYVFLVIQLRSLSISSLFKNGVPDKKKCSPCDASQSFLIMYFCLYFCTEASEKNVLKSGNFLKTGISVIVMPFCLPPWETFGKAKTSKRNK